MENIDKKQDLPKEMEQLAETVKEGPAVSPFDDMLIDKRKRDPIAWCNILRMIGFVVAIIGVGMAFMSAHGKPYLNQAGQIVGFTGAGIYFIGRIALFFFSRRQNYKDT